MSIASFAGQTLLSLFLLAPLGAAQTALAPARGARQGTPEELPTRVRSFTDLGRYSARVQRLGFEGRLPRGAARAPHGAYGVRLELADGSEPQTGIDRRRRVQRHSSAPALTCVGLEPRHEGRLLGSEEEAPGEAWSLRVRFELLVNRASLELRSGAGQQLSVIVHCLAGGEELGSSFFDVGDDYRLLGVECSRPFDELRVQLVNPDVAAFRLDNLACELDLRDSDRDGWIDLVDPCPHNADFGLYDADGDGRGDACDPFPLDPDDDYDQDGIGADLDNCPYVFNPDQSDLDGDGIGDACDSYARGSDLDKDGIPDGIDNCPTTFNPEQADCDADGIGDVCDTSLINPSSVSLTLARGECALVQKRICLPPAPPVVDIAIVFDVTESMAGEIQRMRQNIIGFVNGVRASLPLSNVRFGLAILRDYPATYASCNYNQTYGVGFDRPFRVVAPIGVTDEELLAAISSQQARGGKDQPEAYARALWEVMQPDSGFDFRSDSARFVLLVGDAPPHDCQLGAHMSGCIGPNTTGRDPGRDGVLFTPDDIDFQKDVLLPLRAANVPVLMMYSNPLNFCAWDRWCRVTRGFAVQASTDGQLPPGTDLVSSLVDLIRRPTVDGVTFSAVNPCGLAITFDPTSVQGPIDVTLGAQVVVEETICVPADLPAGVSSLDCDVDFLADGVEIGKQHVHVDVECRTYELDFENEDDFATPLVNGQSVSTPPEFGRLVSISSAGPNLGAAIFDSTPGGPNDPSINSDMLVGHGNMLLLQDSARPQQSGGSFLQPTDDPDGGDLRFDFVGPVEAQSLLLADINPPPNRGATVTLVDDAGRTRIYAVDPGWTGTYGNAGPHRLDLTTLAPQPGNGTPRFARATQDEDFQASRVVRIVVHMTGYGAMDELVFCR